MDSVMLSFLCGAAFIGGAVSVVVCLILVIQVKDKTGREEVKEQWDKQIALLDEQVHVVTRIAAALENKE